MTPFSIPVPRFVPHPLIRGGQAQTFAGKFIPSRYQLYAEENIPLELADGDKLLLHIDEPPPKTRLRPATVLILHGLGGSGTSDYSLRMASKLTAEGFRTVRFNHRGCGPGTSSWAKQIYHCGSKDDVEAAIQFCGRQWPKQKLIVIGYSLSGSILLHLLGCREVPLDLAIAVSSPLDLEACSLELNRLRHVHLNYFYTHILVEQATRRRKAFPQEFHPQLPKKLNLREFDHYYTSQLSGHGSRDRYYGDCSPGPRLKNIVNRTILINSLDDPLTPPKTLADLPTDPHIRVIKTAQGGHMGYIGNKKTRYGDRRWLDALLSDLCLSL